MLSAVDKRPDKRRRDAVLEHDPDHDDIDAVLGRLQSAFAARALARTGITTDGAALSPAPIRTVVGDVPPQLCPLPVLQERTPGVLHALAKDRERWATSQPTVQRGRPSSQDKTPRRLVRTRTSRPQTIRALWQERFVFVHRRLSGAPRQRRGPLTRGLPHLRQRRARMDHIDALCARRCRTQTALGKLKQRRAWGKRFTWIGATCKKVFSPTLEKARAFLDDPW